MTENAFFTAFIASCFAIALALERPTLLRQALPLAAIALTFFVRPQGLVLLAIYALALALKLVFDLREPGQGRGLRYLGRELRRFLPTGLLLLRRSASPTSGSRPLKDSASNRASARTGAS